MKAKFLFGLALFAFVSLTAAQPVEKTSVAKQLQAYYEKGTPPPWSDAIKELSAEKPDKRDAAAKYLVSLLDQAQTDELSGKAPWRATPYWGSSGENPARNLHQQIADDLAKSQTSSATLTVIRWYLDHEKVARFQEMAIAALDKTQAKEADEFCLRLLQPAHNNSVVVLAALKHIGKGKSEIPEAVLKGLCDHYRPSIRDAAHKLSKDRGNADPGAFDPVAAMKRPALTALMTNIGALLDQPAPPDAPFVKVTTTWAAGKESDTSTALGWLVKNDGDSWILLTPFGHRETFHKEKNTKGRREVETIVKSSWDKASIAEEVKRVVELRKKGDPGFALSERGGLTGQFQGRGAGVYEVTLAHWLYTAKQLDLSAQLLLPALDSVYMDSHLVDMMRHRVGEAAGYRMLVAFAGDRDFAETQRLAAALVQRYPGTRFHDYAVKLSKEMPKRQDDFKKLKLPTPEEWAALKKKLNRLEQITFLAERLIIDEIEFDETFAKPNADELKNLNALKSKPFEPKSFIKTVSVLLKDSPTDIQGVRIVALRAGDGTGFSIKIQLTTNFKNAKGAPTQWGMTESVKAGQRPLRGLFGAGGLALWKEGTYVDLEKVLTEAVSINPDQPIEIRIYVAPEWRKEK